MYDFSKEQLGVIDQLSHSFRLTAVSYKSVIGIVVLTVIISILSALAFDTATPVEDGAAADMTAGELFALVIFVFLQSYLYFLMVAIISFEAYSKGDLADAVAFSVKNLHSAVAVYGLFMIALIVGFILLVVPGIILMISLSLCFYCLVLEGTGPIQSLRRSHELVTGNWFRTFTVFMLGTLVIVVIAIMFGFVVGLLAAIGGTTDTEFVANLLEAALTPVIQPYFVALSLVIYHDLRLRSGDEWT